MKKVLFLQNNGKSFGGVWQVNKLIGEALIEKGYDVSIISIRNNRNNLVLQYNPKLHVSTINEQDEWGTYEGTEIKNELFKFHLIKAIKMLISRIKYDISFRKDIEKLHNFIDEYRPNYIITTHYQLLSMIPEKYLGITVNEQHSSFAAAINHKATREMFNKYKDKVKFLWLTKKTMQNAINYGIKNSTYIYNAVRFISEEVADVTKNKKLITIARLSKEKDILRMVTIAKEVFKDNEFKDWILEIYGDGAELENIKKAIGNNKQIKLMGLTNNAKEKLLSASINLNTSPYEGFCLSILEANECGVPTICFDFGESVNEEIINDVTGIIAKDNEDYINKLKDLMQDTKKRKAMAKQAKEFNRNFRLDNIINKWIALFDEMDGV